MLVELKKSEILSLLDLAIDKADTFDKYPKTREVKKFSFKKMGFITKTENIYYEWYVWEVSLPRYLRSLKDRIITANKDKYQVGVSPYVSLLELIAGKDFDPFIIGEL